MHRRILFGGVDDNYQQADTARDDHIAEHAQHDHFKGISADADTNSYRGLGEIMKTPRRAQFFAMRFAASSATNAARILCPYMRGENTTGRKIESRSARIPRRSRDQIILLNPRVSRRRNAVNMIVNGFCKKLLERRWNSPSSAEVIGLSLEGSVG